MNHYDKIQYDISLGRAYDLYRLDWCKERGYDIKDYDDEHGFNGESFVCKAEFETNEFFDKEYIKYLFDKENFKIYLMLLDKIGIKG